MTIKIEVDISSTPPSELVKLAKYMLECAGYSATEQAPVAAAHVTQAEREAVHAPLPELGDDVPAVNVFGGEQPAVPQAPGIEVDSAGMPWDHRIHASSRAKVADGTWRQRRNLDPNVLAQVQAEMLQVMGLPVPAQAAAVGSIGHGASEATGYIAEPAEHTPEQAFIDAVIPPPPPPFAPSAVVPAAPVAIAPPPPSTPAGVATTAFPSSSPVTFPQLVTRITKMLAAKELTQADIAGACQSLGIPHMPALASRPDLIPSMATALGIAL